MSYSETPVYLDRVKETTSSVGTETSIALDGPVQGFQGFSGLGTGLVSTTYCIVEGTNFETGYGHYHGTGWIPEIGSGNFLQRSIICLLYTSDAADE